ncbi:MAG TPA: histidine kinase dimerization/phospho-acceptor domain-containing protein, partial [Pseudomonadales bacterium]|nr:histidine kinase dimerization/phospho-acceptor domain-containing protein [Pseudomonadales bacterium]
MNPTYTLDFLVFFDVILLAVLMYYYRRLRYPFLKLGAVALAVEICIQSMSYSGAFDGSPWMHAVVPGAARMAYLGVLLACVADIAGQRYPARWFGAMVVAFAAAAFYAGTQGQGGLYVVHIPTGILFGLCIYQLVRYRDREGIGALGFAGLLTIHLVLKWSLALFSLPESAAGQLVLFDNMVLLLVGAALVMITSERAISDLVNRDERIEAYAEEHRRLELQFSHAQKLESLGVLAGGIAHDFNNMLTSILGYASLAMKKLPNDSEIRKDLYMVMSGARQAVDLTSQMLIYAGKGALEFEAVDISKVADNMSSLMHSIIPRKIQLVQRLARELPSLKGDQVQL